MTAHWIAITLGGAAELGRLGAPMSNVDFLYEPPSFLRDSRTQYGCNQAVEEELARSWTLSE